MSDFPPKVGSPLPTSILGSFTEGTLLVDAIPNTGGVSAAAAWQAVNQAIYAPVVVSSPVTVYKMGIEVAVNAAGNVDVGIYDYLGNSLVTAGVTAIAAAGVQVFDITDTALVPGVYYLGAWCSTVTTATFMRSNLNSNLTRLSGVQTQASLTTGLPTPSATFTAQTTAFIPLIVAMFTGANY